MCMCKGARNIGNIQQGEINKDCTEMWMGKIICNMIGFLKH